MFTCPVCQSNGLVMSNETYCSNKNCPNYNEDWSHQTGHSDLSLESPHAE